MHLLVEFASVTGKCEMLNNLLCEKIAAELSEKYYDLKIYHSEFGLCRSFWNAKYEWIEQENSIMLYLTTQPLHLDPANFRKEEEAIIDAYNKSSKMPNISLLNILEKNHASRKLKGVWSWELPIEKIEDIIQGIFSIWKLSNRLGYLNYKSYPFRVAFFQGSCSIEFSVLIPKGVPSMNQKYFNASL